MARLVRGAPDRRRRRAHDPDRRAPPRHRLRGAVRRSRRSVTHALLGLGGVPGGRLSPQASAAEAACPRASRSSAARGRIGISSHGVRRCRTNWVRCRRDRPRRRLRHRRPRPRRDLPCGTRSDAGRAPRRRATLLRNGRHAAHGRRRRRLLPRAPHGSGRVHASTGRRAAASRRSRTRRSPRPRPQMPTC